jgi:hypothetical protein
VAQVTDSMHLFGKFPWFRSSWVPYALLFRLETAHVRARANSFYAQIDVSTSRLNKTSGEAVEISIHS